MSENVSIALCTYNGEKYLLDQLNSILEQTRLPDELIVCDDCSVDKTLKILDSFRIEAPFPVSIYRNLRNLGSTKNFEKAIRACSGDIIILCDQDDIWRPDKINIQVETLRENPKAGYVFSNAALVDENLHPLGCNLWDMVGFTEKRKRKFCTGNQFQVIFEGSLVTGATLAFRSYIIKKVIPFPTDTYWIHDGWIAIIAASIGILGIPIDDKLIFYRQHLEQQIGAKGTRKKSWFRMYHEHIKSKDAIIKTWEKKCFKKLKLRDKLIEFLDSTESNYNSAIVQNLKYLKEFEVHFNNRKTIMTTQEFGRYYLIFHEAVSGRYKKFSNSLQSIVRDIIF